MAIIDITDTARLVIEQDEFFDSPLTWGNTVTVPLSRWSDVPAEGTDDLHLAYAIERFHGAGLDEETVTARYARAFHGAAVESYEGALWYLPADQRRDVSLTEQGRQIEAWQGDYRRAVDGEVYTVVLERPVLWTAADGRTRTDWEPVDSLGGNYLDDAYTAQRVAGEHFALSDEETAALELAP